MRGLVLIGLAGLLLVANSAYAQSTPYAGDYRATSTTGQCLDEQPMPDATGAGSRQTQCTSPLKLTLPAGCYHFSYTAFGTALVNPHDGINSWLLLPDGTRIAPCDLAPGAVGTRYGNFSVSGTDDYCIDAGTVTLQYAINDSGVGNPTTWANMTLGSGMAKDHTVPSVLTATPLSN